jgi:acetyl esterase
MPGIHPDFAAFAADPRNTVRPPPPHLALARVRAAADAAMIDPAPPPLARVEDATVASDGQAVPLRLYHPAPGVRLPVIVVAHGGGFVWGSIATHDGLCRRLARASGAAVVSVGYRLAPEAPFPAAMRDVLAAVGALPGLAAAWQIDPARLSLFGDSAGGHVVLTAALALRGAALRPQRLALVYPVVDPSCAADSHARCAEGPILSHAAMRWFWAACLGPQAAAPPPEADPLHADPTGLPPTLIVTAEHDVLSDEGLALARWLARHGVPVTADARPGTVHGYLSIAPDGGPGRETLRAVAAFLAPPDGAGAAR